MCTRKLTKAGKMFACKGDGMNKHKAYVQCTRSLSTVK